MTASKLRFTTLAGLIGLAVLSTAQAQISADTRTGVSIGGQNGVNVGVGAGAGVGRNGVGARAKTGVSVGGRNGVNVGVDAGAGVGGQRSQPRRVYREAPRYDNGRGYDRPHPVRDIVGGALQGTAGIVSGAAGIATGTLSTVGDALGGRGRDDYDRREYREEREYREYRDPREYREEPNGVSLDTNVNIHLGDH